MSLTCNRCDVAETNHSVPSPSSGTTLACDTVAAANTCDSRHTTGPALWDTQSTVDILFENKCYI